MVLSRSTRPSRINTPKRCPFHHRGLECKLRKECKLTPSQFELGGEGNGTPLRYTCLENPMDGGAWWTAVHGVARSRTRLATSLSLFTFMHWRRKWQPTPVFFPGESQGWWSLVCCHLWGHTESDTTEVTQQSIAQFELGVQNEAGQRLIQFCQENTLVIANSLFQQHERPLST